MPNLGLWITMLQWVDNMPTLRITGSISYRNSEHLKVLRESPSQTTFQCSGTCSKYDLRLLHSNVWMLIYTLLISCSLLWHRCESGRCRPYPWTPNHNLSDHQHQHEESRMYKNGSWKGRVRYILGQTQSLEPPVVFLLHEDVHVYVRRRLSANQLSFLDNF